MRIFLETDRLFLRRLTREDAPLLCELDSDPEVMRYLTKGEPTPLEKIEDEQLPKILRFYDEYDHFGYWAVHEKGSGDFIGWFHFKPDDSELEAELGYRLSRRSWGKGYATEVSRVLIRKAFGEWGCERVFANTLVDNLGSRRVMEKSGLRYERTFTYEDPSIAHWSESERQSVEYGLSREDWEKEQTSS